MNNDYETRERILSEALEEIKQKVGSELNSIMGNLYSDYLPHIVGDTDANISYRVEGCIKNILQGKIQVDEAYPNFFYVNDGYGYDHLISLGSYGLDLKPLADIMGETIQTNRIRQLEQEVANLTVRLQDAYSHRSY